MTKPGRITYAVAITLAGSMADQAEQIERRPDLHPAESRRLIRSLIEARYTLPE
jgi:hypothetical protein